MAMIIIMIVHLFVTLSSVWCGGKYYNEADYYRIP